MALIEVPKDGHGMRDGDRLRWNPHVNVWTEDGGESNDATSNMEKKSNRPEIRDKIDAASYTS